MTRLPVESWNVRPRIDLPSYDLNTVCPVTYETSDLEDHHIFRRSFTALGQDNRDLFWVEYDALPPPGAVFASTSYNPYRYVVKNRVALSPEAHQRITTNVARLEYRGTDLWYIEGDAERKLDLNLRLMEGSEKVARKRKKKASTPSERKARVNYTIRTPRDEENVLPELEEALRDHLAPELTELMDDPTKASSYWVWHTAAVRVLQS